MKYKHGGIIPKLQNDEIPVIHIPCCSVPKDFEKKLMKELESMENKPITDYTINLEDFLEFRKEMRG